ncbi:DUF6804 family protein [Arthrobacter sp. ov407]|uniref:DUF6804 family protein n=1 Tax=Arthrobacter sp. ov407 TaxID=1761748 RepID=UPI001C408CC4|nr:DUF6804 family protein [Arthrobacter sp. ov407]
MPQLVGDLNRDEGAVVVEAISQGIHAVRPVRPPAGPADYEPEEFIRCIENHQTPPPWSQALPATSAPTTEVPMPTPLVEFNPYVHSKERHSAAPGFTEAQLDNVPLVTVHPATAPSVMGAVFLLLAFLGGPYELYVFARWAVTAMAIWMSVVAGAQKRTPWVVVFIAIALLFNPLVPVYATREFWIPFNLAGFVLFWVAGVKFRASKPAQPPNYARSL